jgi:hypothetical protein
MDGSQRNMKGIAYGFWGESPGTNKCFGEGNNLISCLDPRGIPTSASSLLETAESSPLPASSVTISDVYKSNRCR